MIKAVLFDFWNTVAYVDPQDAQVKAIADVEHAIEKLKKRYTLAILSNTSSGSPAIHLNELGLQIHFDHFFFSLHTGHRKPEPDAYLHACTSMKLLSEECAYIDDALENVEGAKEIGMQGIHYDGSESMIDVLKKHDLI
jgi:putative hydrolase of the HAD superfamily